MTMTKLAMLVLALGLAAGCHRSDRASDKAADDVVAKQKELNKQMDESNARLNETRDKAAALSNATTAFDDRKQIRLIGLHAEADMIAPQGDMISSLASQLPLTDDAHKTLDDKVATLQQRMNDASAKITDLQNATADQWKDRDNAAADAMKNLESARDDAWKAFKKAKRTDGRAS
jgi:chromosome segregation ATPase